MSDDEDQPETSTTSSWAMHWDGSDWTLARVPHPDGTARNSDNELSDVTCTKQLCWAVGVSAGAGQNGVMLRWKGTRWVRVPTSIPPGVRVSLDEVACVSPSNCWALGQKGRGLEELHWNGSKWAQSTRPYSHR